MSVFQFGYYSAHTSYCMRNHFLINRFNISESPKRNVRMRLINQSINWRYVTIDLINPGRVPAFIEEIKELEGVISIEFKEIPFSLVTT